MPYLCGLVVFAGWEVGTTLLWGCCVRLGATRRHILIGEGSSSELDSLIIDRKH